MIPCNQHPSSIEGQHRNTLTDTDAVRNQSKLTHNLWCTRSPTAIKASANVKAGMQPRYIQIAQAGHGVVGTPDS